MGLASPVSEPGIAKAVAAVSHLRVSVTVSLAVAEPAAPGELEPLAALVALPIAPVPEDAPTVAAPLEPSSVLALLS